MPPRHAAYTDTPGANPVHFSALATKTDANNGETLTPGSTYIVTLFASDGDVQLNVEDSTVAGTRVGASILLKTIGGGVNHRLKLSAQGTDTIVGMGLGSPGADLLVSGGELRSLVLTFIGSFFGAPTWVAMPFSNGDDTAGPMRRMATVATTGPLPAHTPSGAGLDEILTANANGELTVDGVGASLINAGPFSGVLVKDEGDTTKHGVYQIVTAGDGANPWVLRRRSDWAQGGHVAGGTVVVVTQGTQNAGKLFASPPINSPGTAFEWLVNDSRYDVRGRVVTTDATETTLAEYAPTVANSLGILLTGIIQAYDQATDDHSLWKFAIRAHRGGAGVLVVDELLVESGYPLQTAGAATWAIAADVNLDRVRIRVTGEAAPTIEWTAEAVAQESR